MGEVAPWERKEDTECKEFEKLIPGFIGRKLDFPTLKRFYEHWERCGECREELSIQFLVAEGMQRLEDGNAFDLQSELGQRLEETRRKISYNSAFLYIGSALEIVASGFLVWIFVWILL
ncbi:zf-HC2 domain-containing protein [uncultured Acetatifactor sp.]|uniref:zf-HC2 domain-containing protein n=1 Tax=uncultured Acetatifactor sp. TaxID=1671927 RepID=UPI0025E428C4|nr:hypothetical protein [uncultured Acetatifactor sp.]MCI8695635.1 zf-HC2 domain-containing protein [Lachnospiraceae bacterium]MCI9231187.1 zf-HC2 domain-containing protein [Lachnospiraceae bacterium]MCI9571904.1 zf-HC2 domain-containing protein [Lachnospiraceae bacterium]